MSEMKRWEPEFIPELQTFNMRPDENGSFVLFDEYKQQAETIERLKAAIKYSSDYLDENTLNSIGSGSKAHRELKDALNKLEAGEL